MAAPWPIADKVVLVTGAGDGLGRATAIALAEAGATVVATSRRRRKLEALDDAVKAAGRTVTLLPLDLAELDKILPIGPSIHARFGRLDAVIHCAGQLGKLMPVAHLDLDTMRQTMTVDALATQQLIMTLDPLLQATPGARALFVTDRLAVRGKPFLAAYAAAKQAMEAIVLAYAAETRSSGPEVRLVAPPPLATALRKTAYPGESEARQLQPAEAARRLVELLKRAELPADEIIDL